MGSTEYTNIGAVKVEKVSAKAVLIRRGEGTHWVPLSVLEPDTATRVLAKTVDIDRFEAADWFVEKEEIGG